MILSDDNPTVIKRHTDTYSSGETYVGGPVFEASGAHLGYFAINIGGDDYYASVEHLNVSEATALRDMLTAWLERAG